VENVGGDAGIATGSSDGEMVRAPGALGGEPTPNSRSFLIRDGKKEKIRGHRLYELKPHDILLKISGGGAGVGSPAERDPEKVRKDVANEFISIEKARELYKVALNAKTLEVDEKETARLRGKGKTA
jgi:N-methylhydantoinase B